MKYTVYSADGSIILAEQAEADEITCQQCGMSWLRESPVALEGCPYCGDGGFVYRPALAEVALSESAASDVAAYGRDLRGIVHGLWAGTLDAFQAYDLFSDTVRIYLTRAWYEGAKSCGVLPDELSPDEKIAMQEAIVSECSHIWNFLTYVEGHNKAGGFPLAPLTARVEAWTYRYPDVVTRAKLMACGDRKYKWELGPTKEHCIDCSRLHGKVKRGSEWHRRGILPQSRELACGGWKCLCTLTETDEPMSKGPLPMLSGASGGILGIK